MHCESMAVFHHQTHYLASICNALCSMQHGRGWVIFLKKIFCH